VIGPSRLLVNPGGCVGYRVGDHLQVYDPEHGRIRSEGIRITELEESAPGVLLELDRPIGDIVTGASFRDADHLFNLDACGAGAVIRNCRFGIHRGRGILLKTRDCIIENNSFRNREGWGIAMHQFQEWGEGPAARDVLIRRNTFEGVGVGWSAFIDIRPSRRGNAPAEGRPVKAIRIEGNRMVNPPNGVLSVWAAQGLEFINNTIEAAAGTRTAPGALLSFFTGGNITVRDLNVYDRNEKTTAVIYAAPEVAADGNGLSVAGVSADVRPGTPIVYREGT